MKNKIGIWTMLVAVATMIFAPAVFAEDPNGNHKDFCKDGTGKIAMDQVGFGLYGKEMVMTKNPNLVRDPRTWTVYRNKMHKSPYSGKSGFTIFSTHKDWMACQ